MKKKPPGLRERGRTIMLEDEKISLGQTVWFDNNGQIESGCVIGFRVRSGCRVTYCIRKEPDANGVASVVEDCSAAFLYGSRLDCLRVMLKYCDTMGERIAFQAAQLERHRSELVAEIELEERAAQIKTEGRE